jgi:hypothetical protein
MKKNTLLLMLAYSLSVVSCGKSDDVNAFIAERKGVIGEVSQKMSAGDVDGAKTIFDAKKDSLKSSCKAAQSNVTDKMKWAESQMSDLDIFTKAMNSEKVGKDIPTLNKTMALLSEINNICN